MLNPLTADFHCCLSSSISLTATDTGVLPGARTLQTAPPRISVFAASLEEVSPDLPVLNASVVFHCCFPGKTMGTVEERRHHVPNQ